MASLQHRWGPQVSGLGGACQSFWDGLKNMFKQPILPLQSGMGALLASPVVALLLSQLGWCGILVLDASFQAFIILAAGGLTVYAVMLSGWSSNSAYGFLGCWRTLALMLSYELCLGSALLGLGVMNCDTAKSFNFASLSVTHQAAAWPLGALFLIAAVAECKRLPFDLPEAEAELVAGFHVELSSLHFVLFFIAEYASMAVMSALASVFFFGGLQVITLTALICALILTRGCLPRYRYDQFMRLGWKAFLPLSLAFFSFYASV